MAFPKQEYGSGLPFPSPGNLGDPGIEPTSPALAGGQQPLAGGLFTTEPDQCVLLMFWWVLKAFIGRILHLRNTLGVIKDFHLKNL